MRWRRAKGRVSGRILFSKRPAGLFVGAVAVVLAGGLGAAFCSLVHPLLPGLSPLACLAGAVVATFAVTFLLVHRFHRVEPIGLAKTVYLLCVLLLAGMAGGGAVFGLLVPLGGGGIFSILVGCLVLALPPALLVLLAIGDKGPPVDETRLGEPPRL